MGSHGILILAAIATVILMFIAYIRFSEDNNIQRRFKKIIFNYMIAFFFSAARWAGGTYARIGYDFTNTLTFNVVWTLTGICAAFFGLYASKLLLDFSRSSFFKNK